MSDDDIINVRELMQHCIDTDDDCDVYVYINEVPIGFGVESLDYDFDGSLKIHIKDSSIKINEED
ncbi:MAG: hypothetical protein IJF83_07350 [Methanobrevibacter sp.]|nr:hypothetical protein [Methanobrevibacter sp.]